MSIINKQVYAFFPFTHELADYCIDNLQEEYSIGTSPDGSTCIRLSMDLAYVFATRTSTYPLHLQRPLLKVEDFYPLMLLPDVESRSTYITQLYQEKLDKGLRKK